MWRWREHFANNPNQAIADLFSGRAGTWASSRRDVPEILFQEFPDRPEFATLREKLDEALFSWLDNMRNNQAQQIESLTLNVYSLRICEALRAMQLLNLPNAVQHFQKNKPMWLSWLDTLYVAPERDPASIFLTLIARATLIGPDAREVAITPELREGLSP